MFKALCRLYFFVYFYCIFVILFLDLFILFYVIIYLEVNNMLYPESIMMYELMWRYKYKEEQARSIIENYKSQNKYSELCDLITYRMNIADAKENLLIRYQG